jgi:hypothetical protein
VVREANSDRGLPTIPELSQETTYLSLPFSLSTLCKLRCTSCKKRANHRITNPTLLIAIAFLAGGFAAINKFAPEPVQFGDRTITQKHLYIGLFVIGKLSPTGDIVPGTDDLLLAGRIFCYSHPRSCLSHGTRSRVRVHRSRGCLITQKENHAIIHRVYIRV